jgi:transcriptional regulator of arginine metabolism
MTFNASESSSVKHKRHATIRELLDRAPISSQDELRRKLASKGYHVTQATLSRDIRELSLSKGPNGYSAPSFVAVEEEEDSLPGIREVLRTFGLEVKQAMNLLVIITSTSSAQPVAAGIDYEEWPEVLGTVAGDDTVLVICPDEKQAKACRIRIEGYIG